MKNITNDLVTEYICSYYKPVSDQLEELRRIGEEGNIPIILRETELFLNSILALKQPKKILEIGTAIGYSAAYFRTKCPKARVYTVEKDEYAYKAAQKNTSKLFPDGSIKLYLGDGQEQVEKMRDSGISGFDFVFIDAAKSHYQRFLDGALSVCERDAVIVSDNILQRGMTVSDAFDTFDKHRTNIKKMRSYVDCICSDPTLDTSIYSIGDGIALSIYRGEDEKN